MLHARCAIEPLHQPRSPRTDHDPTSHLKSKPITISGMTEKVQRRTVDLSAYPDLVVIYLGMRVNRLTGLKTLFGFGPKIANSAAATPHPMRCSMSAA